MKLTRKELTEKVGKNLFFADGYTLAAILNYKSGLPSFDKYLDGKTLKQIHAVIHLIKYPKGIVIKIAKNFSSFPFGLAYSEIKRIELSEKSGTSKLIIETSDEGKIIFSLKTTHSLEVRQFLDSINLKYDFESSITNQRQPTDKVYNTKHRKK